MRGQRERCLVYWLRFDFSSSRMRHSVIELSVWGPKSVILNIACLKQIIIFLISLMQVSRTRITILLLSILSHQLKRSFTWMVCVKLLLLSLIRFDQIAFIIRQVVCWSAPTPNDMILSARGRTETLLSLRIIIQYSQPFSVLIQLSYSSWSETCVFISIYPIFIDRISIITVLIQILSYHDLLSLRLTRWRKSLLHVTLQLLRAPCKVWPFEIIFSFTSARCLCPAIMFNTFLILFILCLPCYLCSNIDEAWDSSSQDRAAISIITRRSALSNCFNKFPSRDVFDRLQATCSDVLILSQCVKNTALVRADVGTRMVAAWTKNHSPPCVPVNSPPILLPVERTVSLADVSADSHAFWLNTIKYTSDDLTMSTMAAHFAHFMLSFVLLVKCLIFIWYLFMRIVRYLGRHQFNKSHFFRRRNEGNVSGEQQPVPQTCVNIPDSNPFVSIPPITHSGYAAATNTTSFAWGWLCLLIFTE